MKEKDFISIIKTTLNSSYIGDDCALLKDLEIVVSQDSLVEGVHFSLDYTTPKQLGYKAVMTSVSDIAASGGKCMYLTISLSLPSDIDRAFVEELYKGAKSACTEDIEIVGGDITGADKIFISVCAIGSSKNRNISSRSKAKEGYKVIVFGEHGSSAAGLKILQAKEGDVSVFAKEKMIKAHLEPVAYTDFGSLVGKTVKEEYAMMDTSDGLMDALSTIANESGVLLDIDFDKIPHDKNIEQFENWQNLVLFGGEDYGLVAVVPEKYDIGGIEIGQVKSGLGVDLKINNSIKHYSKQDVENKIFNHFN